jgi:hypothetical protein
MFTIDPADLLAAHEKDAAPGMTGILPALRRTGEPPIC